MYLPLVLLPLQLPPLRHGFGWQASSLSTSHLSPDLIAGHRHWKEEEEEEEEEERPWP